MSLVCPSGFGNDDVGSTLWLGRDNEIQRKVHRWTQPEIPINVMHCGICDVDGKRACPEIYLFYQILPMLTLFC